MKYWIAVGLVAMLALPAAAAAQAPADDAWIVVYEPSAVDSVDRETDARERRRGFRARHRYRRAIEGFAARLSDEQVRALRADPDVAAVVRDRPVRALAAQTIATGDLAPTGIRRLGLAAQPSATPRWVREASDVGVAVLDTGIDLDHPDLNATDGTDCVNLGTSAEDENGHGTHVAGTIGAENDGAGVTGVAPGTEVHAVRVLNSTGDGSSSTVLCGLEWVIDEAAARDIRVVNMSLGGPGRNDRNCGGTDTNDPDLVHRAICKATGAGILSVAAAGNSTWDITEPPPDTPATYPEVLTVSAVSDGDGAPGKLAAPNCPNAGGEADDTVASYSNFTGSASDEAHMIAAPGTCIASTWLAGGYNTISGTSMATPHVAGAAALCIAEAGEPGPCAGMTPAQMIQRFRADAEAFRAAESDSGFVGDPAEPFTEPGAPLGVRYYGYMMRPLLPGPATSFSSTPPDTTDDSTPRFEFGSPTPGTTFECSLDGGAFAACSSPLETGALPDGGHRLEVRAVDVAGNRDGSPAADTFTVDAVADPPPPPPPPPPPVTGNQVPEQQQQPAPPPPDATAPQLAIGASSRQSLRTALSKGIRVNVLCDEACRAETRLELSGASAGRKGLTLGTGKRTVTIRLTSATRRKLARVRSALVRLRVTVTDAAGNTTSTKKNLRLTR